MKPPRILQRARREDGYSLVISMLLLSIMMVLLSVSLQAGTSSLQESHLSIEWSKALTVAEAGANQATTLLGQSRGATNPCRIGTSTLCSGGGGEYQMAWVTSGSKVIITSTGYYPTQARPTFVRQIQVTYEPVPSFKYAIFSQTSLDVKNNMTVIGRHLRGKRRHGRPEREGLRQHHLLRGRGDVLERRHDREGRYPVRLHGQSRQRVDRRVGRDRRAQSASRSKGTRRPRTPRRRRAVPSARRTRSSGAGRSPGPRKRAVRSLGGSRQVRSTPAPPRASRPPSAFPAFTFDPNNYSSDALDPLHLQCYPTGGTCGSNDATNAVSSFQSYVTTHKTSLTGTFAVWQRTPTSSTAIDLDGIKLSGDFTLHHQRAGETSGTRARSRRPLLRSPRT